jgi:RNA polymerase sigma-70 factor (ECF subfamily)
MDDADARLRMGPIEPEALGKLFREHAPALRLYARQWATGGEDEVQEAFVKLARQVPVPERVVAWLYRVVRNAAIAARHADNRRRRREGNASIPEAWFAQVDERLDAEEATRCLGELGLELREIIVARLWGGLTFAEIAEMVGCSLPTAHRRYQAGLLELRERLEGRWTKTSTPPQS